jgi:hypothetical protein
MHLGFKHGPYLTLMSGEVHTMASSHRRLALLLGMLLLANCGIAAEPRQLDLQPGKTLRYRMEKTLTGSLKIFGDTTKTDETWIVDLVAKVTGKDEQGRWKLDVTVERVQASVPTFKGITVVQKDFDDRQSSAPPAHSLLPFLVMKTQPLQLHYESSGKLAAVTGGKEIAEQIDPLLTKHFRNEPDFPNAKVFFPMLMAENVQKLVWDDLLIVDLPEEIDAGTEWKEQKLTYVQSFYVWMNVTHLADVGLDGSLELESTYKMPKSKPANVKFGNQDYDYTVKNGEGTGTFKLDPDGTVRELDTTWHVYLDTTLNAGGQKIPFDEFYHRLKYKIRRVESAE